MGLTQRVDGNDPVPSCTTPRRHPHSPAGSEPAQPPPPLPPPWFPVPLLPVTPQQNCSCQTWPFILPRLLIGGEDHFPGQSLALTPDSTLMPSFGDRRLVRSESALSPLSPQQILLAEVGRTPLTWVLSIQHAGKTPLHREPRLATGTTAAPPPH